MWKHQLHFRYLFTGMVLCCLTLWTTTTNAGQNSAFITIKRGSNLSLFDMFDLQGVQCGDMNTSSFRDGKIDTFRDKECNNKTLIISFISSSGTTRTIELHDNPPTIQMDAFMRLPINSVDPPLQTASEVDKLQLVLNAGNYELILTRDNDTSSGYAAVFNSPAEEERPRFFFVKFVPTTFTLGHNQSLLGEIECWKQAFDEFDTLKLQMSYDSSCKETNATYRYGSCTEAVAEELCDCDCAYFEKMRSWETLVAFDNSSEEAKEEKLAEETVETKQKLSVNKTALSSGIRKKISATDDRSSATNIGILGTLMLGLVVGSLLFCDLLSIKRHIRSIKKHAWR